MYVCMYTCVKVTMLGEYFDGESPSAKIMLNCPILLLTCKGEMNFSLEKFRQSAFTCRHFTHPPSFFRRIEKRGVGNIFSFMFSMHDSQLKATRARVTVMCENTFKFPSAFNCPIFLLTCQDDYINCVEKFRQSASTCRHFTHPPSLFRRIEKNRRKCIFLNNK
jgi:hypothetical protein